MYRYKKTAVEVGKLLKDQPLTGLEKVVWWTEYVIRNQGAPYLKSPRANISWSEFLILDVLAFLFSVLTIALFVFYKLGKNAFRLAFDNKKFKKKSE